MKWHDFFYFSKGERRSLAVLLCLITAAGILLIVNERKPAPEEAIPPATVQLSGTEQPDATPDAPSPADPPAGAKQEQPKSKPAATKKAPEPVADRVKRLSSYARPAYPRSEKFKEGAVVELNTADTATLKKVPGIGSSYAKRIVGYRNLLGGYYAVTQLGEIYGMDEERYRELAPWFSADPSLVAKIAVNDASRDSLLRRHPYLNREQTKIILQLRRQKGKISWENLQLLDEFTDDDRRRLQHYLSFE